jgi:L-amino acid N-acyltransferase YncA
MTGSSPRRIRDAAPGDAVRCTEIYAPYVVGTTISFESEPPVPEEMARRIAQAQERHAWLVLEDGATVAGYAYGGPFMGRAAYAWSTAVSVYVDEPWRRTGAGRAMYEALFDRLAGRGLRMALAGITLPNEPSVGLHRALGFAEVGTYRRVGWKHGAWRDVLWLQRPLGDDDGPPDAAVPAGAVSG